MIKVIYTLNLSWCVIVLQIHSSKLIVLVHKTPSIKPSDWIFGWSRAMWRLSNFNFLSALVLLIFVISQKLINFFAYQKKKGKKKKETQPSKKTLTYHGPQSNNSYPK